MKDKIVQSAFGTLHLNGDVESLSYKEFCAHRAKGTEIVFNKEFSVRAPERDPQHPSMKKAP